MATHSLQDAKEQFDKELREVIALRKKPTILVFGLTGTGKTSLAQAILGRECVPDDAITQGPVGTRHFIEYKTEFLTLVDSRGFEPADNESEFISTIQSEVRRRQNSQNIQEHIHLVWYCIEGSRARVTDTDSYLIKTVFPFNNVQVVITKNDITKDKQREGIFKVLTNKGIPQQKITFVASEEKNDPGIAQLVEKSLQILPDAYKDAFFSKQQVNLDLKAQTAQEIIRKTVVATGLWGAIPFTDIPVVIPLQLRMVSQLTNHYGLEAGDAKQLISPVVIHTLIIGATSTIMLMDTGGIVGSILGAFGTAAITNTLGQLINAYLYNSVRAIVQEGKKPSDIKPFQPSKEEFLEAIKRYKK